MRIPWIALLATLLVCLAPAQARPGHKPGRKQAPKASLAFKTEAEHVAGNHPITLRERLPQVMPIPTGGREAMNQQQRFTLPRHPVANGLAAKHKALPAFAPDA